LSGIDCFMIKKQSKKPVMAPYIENDIYIIRGQRVMLDEDLAEKLKINLEDLLTQKRLLFSLDAKYLEILARMSSKDNLPTEEELKFFENYPEALRDIYKRIQTELGLPTEPEEKKVE